MKKELNFWNLVRTLPNGVQCFNIKKENAPKVYEEIIRISEKAFNIGNARDEYDDFYSYLVVYDSLNNEIISYYRYILITNDNIEKLSTAQYYNYHPQFVEEVLVNSIELGRSVINKSSKVERESPGIGLRYIWKGGLGPLVYRYNGLTNEKKYLFGQVSLQAKDYSSNINALNKIFALFLKNFGLSLNMIYPKETLNVFCNSFYPYLEEFEGNYKNDAKKLKTFLKENGIHVPSLFFHYGNLDSCNSGSLKMFLPVYNSLLDCYEMALCYDLNSLSDAHKKMFIGDTNDINLSAFDE